MSKITEEQLKEGARLIQRASRDVQEGDDFAGNAWSLRVGIAAEEYFRPLHFAEALKEPTDEEIATADKDTNTYQQTVKVCFANRLARLTSAPDPAVEAVKAQVMGDEVVIVRDGYTRRVAVHEIVAAVDAARAKK